MFDTYMTRIMWIVVVLFMAYFGTHVLAYVTG